MPIPASKQKKNEQNGHQQSISEQMMTSLASLSTALVSPDSLIANADFLKKFEKWLIIALLVPKYMI